MKMYILIHDLVKYNHPEFAPVIAAHSSLATYLKFEKNDDMQKWVNGIFKKCVCIVNEKEFQKAKEVENSLIITESALNNKEVAIGFCPREGYPKQFKYFRLYH